MGLFTYRQTKKTRKEVAGLRSDLAKRNTPKLVATTPEEGMRMAALQKRRPELMQALGEAGFKFKLGKPWGEDDVVAYNAALYYVVKEGLTINEAAAKAAETRAAVEL